MVYFSIDAHIKLSGTVLLAGISAKVLDLLHYTINMGWGKGGDAIPQDCCIPPLQQHAQASPEVVDSFTFVLPSVTSQCCPKFPHLTLPCAMPPTK